MKVLIRKVKILTKESFNIDNKHDLKYKNKGSIPLFLLLVISLVLLSLYSRQNEVTLIQNIFNELINFLGVIIGFSITSLVFLAGTFVEFKKNQLKGYDEIVKNKICQQISSTFVLSIIINISIVVIGMIYNNILNKIIIPISDNYLFFVNFIIFAFIYSLLAISLLLLIKSISYLKKYIDMIIKG